MVLDDRSARLIFKYRPPPHERTDLDVTFSERAGFQMSKLVSDRLPSPLRMQRLTTYVPP